MWPPKGPSGCENTSFEPLSVKIAPKLRLVAATKKQTDGQDRYVNKEILTKTCFLMHAQIRSGRIDSKCCTSTPCGGRSNVLA